MPGTFRYLVADLRTNALLAELPLRGVTFESRLDAVGSFRGTLDLGDPGIKNKDVWGSTQEGRTALYVDSDGVLVWGGIIWTRKYKMAARTVEFGGQEFWSYFAQRVIAATKTYTNQDQIYIAQDLINYAQSPTGGNIGVTVGSETSGVLRSQTWNYYEYKPVHEAVQQMAALDQGFDFAVDVAYDSNGTPQKYLHLAYPRRGRVAGSTGLVFDSRTNMLDYEWDGDAATAGTTFYVTGAGQQSSMLRSVNTVTSYIDAGYPILENVKSYKDLAVQSSVDAHAVSLAKTKVPPVTIAHITLKTSADPVLGSYITGDDARIIISDERFPAKTDGSPGLDTYKRIAGWQVQPADHGGVSEVKVEITDLLA